MKKTLKAIEDAYSEQVRGLYKTFSQSLLAAGNDQQEIGYAEERFTKGLAHANDARKRALALAGD